MTKKAKSGKKPKIQFKNITQNIKSKKKVNNTENTDKKAKKKPKSTKRKVLIVFMGFMIACALACLSFCIYIIVASPEFDVKRLYRSGSSVVYDADMNVIAEMGAKRRDNVTYDELPDVLIDAIVATEDSKFFQHSGIDLLRFGKAVVGQLLGHSDAGGGSTLTMQLVKNNYSSTISTGIEGIIRKFTDIYMAVFKIEKTYTKQEIMEFYVNQGFFGSGAYGVEQAAQTFFGKSVSEINLSEAATLAGLFQAPGAYDPYKYPEKAQNRRNIVLNLMVRHGYITEQEAETAKAIKLEDMLTGYNYSYSEVQGFLDALVVDVIKETGLDPATTSMNIYTTLKMDKQKVINQLYDGTLWGNSYKWRNDAVQCGIAVTDVDTGAVVAIGAGRNQKGERLYNYATDIRRHPGSTAKPLLDYGPAIEYEGWGSGTSIIDDVYTYSNGTSLFNVDKKYSGILTAKTALAKSRNIPALQTFQATSQEEKYEFITSLGITPELINGEILESSSIGAFNGVSPLQLSAAYGAFARGGYYIEPYTFTKIEFNDTNETYSPVRKRTKVMSEETAYIINYMLKYAVTSGEVATSSPSGTDVASKTGTTSEDEGLKKQLGLSSSAIKDSWQVMYSPDYSIAFWYGYKSTVKEHYLTTNEGWTARRNISRAITSRILEKNSRWEKPSGVTFVDVELGTFPTQLASEYTPDNLRSTEVFKKGTEPTEVSTRFQKLDDVSNLTYNTVGNQVHLSWSPIDTPEAINDEFLQSYFEKGYGRWAEKYYQQRLEYNAGNVGTVLYEIFVKNSDGSLYSIGTTSATSFTTSITNASSATYVVRSRYSIFGANASSGREITVKLDVAVDPPTPPEGNGNTDDDTDQEETD